MSAAAQQRECRWCARPATDVRVVIPGSSPIVADVCDEHAAMVDRNVRRQELEQTIRQTIRRLARTESHTPRHAALVGELGAARLELAELNS